MSFGFLPLYTGDYLRDTRHLTPMKHGVYLLLLMHCWDQKGPLPLDEQEAAGVATVLYSHYTLSIDVAPMIKSLRDTLSAVVEILSRARAAAKGIEWLAKFLAVFPPLVLVFVGLTTREAGQIYARNPLYLLPVLLGSAGSYWLSMRMVRNGLSIEASMGLQSEGTIPVEQMGAIDLVRT